MKNKGKCLIVLGLLLMAAALFLTGYNLYEQQRAKESSRQVMDVLKSRILPKALGEGGTKKAQNQQPLPNLEKAAIADYLLYPDMEMPVKTIDGIDYIGVLQIPALSLELPIISTWSYPNLKIAPCRYSGSAYGSNLILCAHNYPSHFGNLNKLREGDIATFTDMDGNVFTYTLVERETLPPDDADTLTAGDWDLTLFTCTVGGQSRVTLRFALVRGFA
ncbi:MAG: sortase [Faecousia sp.]